MTMITRSIAHIDVMAIYRYAHNYVKVASPYSNVAVNQPDGSFLWLLIECMLPYES